MNLPDMISDVEHHHESLTLLALLTMACFGGVVKWCRNPHHKKRTFISFITCFLTAAFTGLQAHFIMTWLNVDMSLQFAISGAVGYSGGILLDSIIPVARKIFLQRIGTYAENATNTNKETKDVKGESDKVESDKA